MDPDYIQRQNSNRFSLIRRIYELSGGDSPFSIQLSELADSIGIQIADADLAAEYLHAEGLIEFTAFGPTISITHLGVVEVEKALANPDAPTSSFPPVNIMVIGSVTGSQIQQGTERSSQTAQFHETDLPALRDLVSLLRSQLPSLNLESGISEEYRSELSTIEAQASSPRPKPAIIREPLSSLRAIIEGAAGSAVAALLLERLARFL